MAGARAGQPEGEEPCCYLPQAARQSYIPRLNAKPEQRLQDPRSSCPWPSQQDRAVLNSQQIQGQTNVTCVISRPDKSNLCYFTAYASVSLFLVLEACGR